MVFRWSFILNYKCFVFVWLSSQCDVSFGVAIVYIWLFAFLSEASALFIFRLSLIVAIGRMLGIFTLYMAVDCIRLTIGSAQIRVSMGFEPILNPIVCEL